MKNKKRAFDLLSLKRNSIYEAISVLTGHWLFGKHRNRLGITTSHSCRSCGDTDEGETMELFLCSYPALASLRLKTLGNYFFDSPIEMSKNSIKDLMCYINGTKRFTRTDSTLLLNWFHGYINGNTMGLIGPNESKTKLDSP